MIEDSLVRRIEAYLGKRLSEPSTWAGILALLSVLIGRNLDPDQQALVVQIGVAVGGGLLVLAREGRNKPDNPTLKTTITGQMPEPPPVVVPPSTEGLHPTSIAPDVEADDSGYLHVKPEDKK